VAAVVDHGCWSHPASLKLRPTSRLRLSRKFGTFQQNRAGTFHFIECAIDVARLQLNSEAGIQKDIEKQEVTPVSRVLVTS
jgi:hypothetical protein